MGGNDKMIFERKKYKEYDDRLRFAWVPTKMDNGDIVFFEDYVQSMVYSSWWSYSKKNASKSYKRMKELKVRHLSEK